MDECHRVVSAIE